MEVSSLLIDKVLELSMAIEVHKQDMSLVLYNALQESIEAIQDLIPIGEERGD